MLSHGLLPLAPAGPIPCRRFRLRDVYSGLAMVARHLNIHLGPGPSGRSTWNTDRCR